MSGPLIVASNHPSAFLEASLLATIFPRPLHFLVRGDMFHPRFRWLFAWTNQIPIFRQKDGIANLRKNASSFDLTYRKLGEGHAVLIFPEAKTLLEKRLRPIQRGTAHLAFGAIPFIPEGEVMYVLPVGVNFTEPRQAGTDVLVKVGHPFPVQAGSREDRNAIERFTKQLEEAMTPLVVDIHDPGHEPHYEVLVSLYYRFFAEASGDRVASDLDRIAGYVNAYVGHKELWHQAGDHLNLLRQAGVLEAAFFPGLLAASRAGVLSQLIPKIVWWLSGGWIWRLMRRILNGKIKASTFQAPSAIGAGMVIFALVLLIMVILVFAMAWPLWIPLVWILVMWSGEWIAAPLTLTWKIMVMPSRLRRSLRQSVRNMRMALKAEMAL